MKIPVFKIFKYSRRASIVTVVVGLVVIFGSLSAYAAKSDALPGSTLYPLKQLWEKGQLVLSFSPVSKAQTHVSIAQDRIKAAQAVPVPTTVLVPALQEAQQQLNSALSQASGITDQTQRKEINKSISDAAAEATAEAEHASESESASSSDKQDLQKTSDQIKQVQDQASTDD